MSLTSIEPHKESRRIDRREAAKYLGIAYSTLAKLAVFGGGPVMIRYGKRVVYDTAELDLYMANRVRRSTSDDGTAAVAA